MDGHEGAVHSALRDELAAVGFVPTASRLYRPSPGMIGRRTLVDQVLDRQADVVTVTAPPGYGKSTFVADLAIGSDRPTAWVSLTSAEDQPAVLLSHVAVAMDEIEPVAPGCGAGLWARSPTIGSPGVQLFGAMLAARRQPFVLLLDDVHQLTSRDALDCLAMLVSELPAGSTLVLTSRTAIPLPLGRMRVQRRLVEVGPDQLAFGAAEAARLFDVLGVDAPRADLRRMVERTEGWPVALYLAAVAQSARPDPVVDAVDRFTGEHRYLTDFLAEELLAILDPDIASFLMEASCFERMSGTLCDNVLDRGGSAQLLETLQRSTLLVIPLDDRREWYRFHHLMVEFLQQELARRDPERRVEIHRRASNWCDGHGDGDGAVVHALNAGEVDRAEAMVLRWYGAVGTANKRYPTIERWIEMFSPDQLAARPTLMVIAGWSRFAAGEPGRAVQWLARAAASLPERHPDDVSGIGAAVVGLALARSIIVAMPPAEMAAEARYVHDHVAFGEGHPMSCLALGAAAFMLGDEEEAWGVLREGADTTLDRPIPVANCLAHLAIIDGERGRWDDATSAARRARAMFDEIADLPTSVLVLAVSVLVETHAGRSHNVAADRMRCRQHLIDLAGVAPLLNLQSRIALARAALIAGKRVEADALLDEVDDILTTTPGAVGVVRQVASLRRESAVRGRTQDFGPGSLTTAELRVLQLLPTHFTVAEIADRLYVSRNTVKSQTIAIYRKLGTSSRAGAIDLAVAAGLLDGTARHA